MKKLLFLTAVAVVLMLASCSKAEETTPAEQATETQADADAVTTASIVNTEAAFRTAISAQGSWIIAILEDMSFTEEIVIAGEFTRNDELYRKLAFYSQDENRTITARYTVTAPRMTVRSPNTRLQGGTFAGDVHVEAPGFHLVDGTVEGDIYFASQEYAEGFTADENSTVTGELIVE
jgi:hypothetical protein